MSDPVLAALGLPEKALERPEGRRVVVRELRRFLTAGGVLTWSLWRRLAPGTQAAFLAASESIGLDRELPDEDARLGEEEAALAAAAARLDEREVPGA